MAAGVNAESQILHLTAASPPTPITPLPFLGTGIKQLVIEAETFLARK